MQLKAKKVAWFLTKDEQTAYKLESRAIKHYRPRLNKTSIKVNSGAKVKSETQQSSIDTRQGLLKIEGDWLIFDYGGGSGHRIKIASMDRGDIDYLLSAELSLEEKEQYTHGFLRGKEFLLKCQKAAQEEI